MVSVSSSWAPMFLTTETGWISLSPTWIWGMLTFEWLCTEQMIMISVFASLGWRLFLRIQELISLTQASTPSVANSPPPQCLTVCRLHTCVMTAQARAQWLQAARCNTWTGSDPAQTLEVPHRWGHIQRMTSCWWWWLVCVQSADNSHMRMTGNRKKHTNRSGSAQLKPTWF